MQVGRIEVGLRVRRTSNAQTPAGCRAGVRGRSTSRRSDDIAAVPFRQSANELSVDMQRRGLSDPDGPFSHSDGALLVVARTLRDSHRGEVDIAGFAQRRHNGGTSEQDESGVADEHPTHVDARQP